MSKRREDLVVKYNHVPAKPRTETSGMVAQSLPMAAMFLRNKMLSWTAMFLSVQSYLSEPTNKVKDPKDTSQPPLLKLAFAAISLVTCYIDIIFPSQPTAKTAKSAAETIVSSATSILSTATN